MWNSTANQMRIYIIRHGKTKGNTEHRYVGQATDEQLLPGERNELKQELTIKSNAVLFISPMLRAKQTAEILFPGKEAVVVSDFIETNFGDFEYHNYEELNGNPDYQSWVDRGGIDAFPKGESVKDMRTRVERGMKAVIAECRKRNASEAVIVAHGGTAMSIMANATGENYFDFMVKNGEGFCLDLEVSLENEIHVVSYHRISCRISA